MGNQVYLYADKKHIGTMNNGLGCFAYVQTIIQKYNPYFNLFSDDINSQLDVVYEKCTPSEEIPLLLFINDQSEFNEDSIPNIEKAIKEYPENFNDGPKRIMEKFLALMLEYKNIKTSYEFTDMVLMVTSKKPLASE